MRLGRPRLGLKVSLRLPTIATIGMLLLVGIVAGAMLLYYDWTMTLTGANPKVRFYKWADATQTNTINLPYNIYPNSWLIDENATYGIKNNDASNDYTVYLWVEAISDASKLANLTITILHPNGTHAAKWTTTTFTNVGETYAVNWLANRNTIYTIQVLVSGSNTIAVGDTVTCDLRLKTIT